MRIKVHVQGITGSRSVKPGEDANVLLHGILEVDGSLIEEVGKIEVVFGGGELTTVKPHLMPGAFEVVVHTDESWPELLESIKKQQTAYAGSGKVRAESIE